MIGVCFFFVVVVEDRLSRRFFLLLKIGLISDLKKEKVGKVGMMIYYKYLYSFRNGINNNIVVNGK